MTKKLFMYGIYDVKVKSYSQPFFVEHDQWAERNFIRLCRDETTNMHHFPEDYELHFLGEFDTTTGETTVTLEVLVQGKNIGQKN